MEKLLENKYSKSESARAISCPSDRYVFIEHHKPKSLNRPYHFHPSIEINYLHDCDMTYSFSGNEVKLDRRRLCVFWAAYPHSVTGVSEDGSITNAYISLTEFLRCSLPLDFTSQILSGSVIVSKRENDADRLMVERWLNEIDKSSPAWQRMHAMEIKARLNRLAIEGWDVLLPSHRTPQKNLIGRKAVVQFEEMLRFISDNFFKKITIEMVAKSGNISPNYAMSLFRKILGATIKEHITDIRIFHAKMLLSETDDKIFSIAADCGYGSVSVFYDNFHQKAGITPAKFRKSTR